ncbi:hypothetical protein APHAL10511_003675 [Amanita phalloides]|nr:hypothetical protein APHAL10511_003675 [Amanita phalloides]
MSVYCYVDAPNSNLTCCICRNPFVEPTKTKTCAHTFCYECILDALLHAPQCPIDRSPLSVKELGPADSIVRALVDELLVECIHREQGCDHACQRQLLPAHLREDCAYSEVPCQEEGCTEQVLRRDMDSHMRIKHEEKAPDAICVGAEHDVNSPSTRLNCPQSQNGCPFTTNEPDILSAHLETCGYEGIKGYFGVCAGRRASLVEQNMLLRHRVSALETSVQILRREMEIVKQALGPWFRTEVNGARQDGVPSTTLVEDSQNSNYEAQDVQLYVNMMTSGDAHGAENGGEMPDPQGYHRAALGFPPLRAPHLSASTSRPIYTPSNIVPVPHLSSVVAPLDLGTSVQGTLSGLRESVLALAAGVDSLGRRSEIALTNESFRFGEEIMSLRASINGLRMQVHTMMMERNAQFTGHGQLGEDGMWITKL